MSSNKNNLLSYRHRQRVRFWLWLVVVWACCSFVFIHQHSNSLVKENNSWEDYNYDGLATVVASWPDIIRSVASDQASDADLASDATASLSTTNTSSFTTTTTSDQAPSAQASSDQSPSARASSEPEHHALVVPYRDRPKHLQVFLDHMGPWFESHYPDKQFSIWIVEQDDNDLFNRAWLGNVGITEIIKHQPNTHCIIFHDVDLIPNASTTNMVPYPKCDLPIQLGSELEHFNWTVPYPTSFGGITSMSQKHWKQINGLSNDYVGWGGEGKTIHTCPVLYCTVLYCDTTPLLYQSSR